MFPHMHFIVAMVPALAYVLIGDRQPPTPRFAGAVFLGSQFPDLIDKPLAHELMLIPSGRVFMHSLPTAVPILLIVGLYGWKTDRLRLSGAFIFAHLSHILADHRELLQPTPEVSSDLLWPFFSPVARSGIPAWGGPEGIYVHLWSTFSLMVVSITVHILARSEKEQIGVYWDWVAQTTNTVWANSPDNALPDTDME